MAARSRAMCERCKAIDGGIVSLELLRDTIADPLKLALIDEAIRDLRSEKAALHATGASTRGA
jgi:hypothetical protein